MEDIIWKNKLLNSRESLVCPTSSGVLFQKSFSRVWLLVCECKTSRAVLTLAWVKSFIFPITRLPSPRVMISSLRSGPAPCMMRSLTTLHSVSVSSLVFVMASTSSVEMSPCLERLQFDFISLDRSGRFSPVNTCINSTRWEYKARRTLIGKSFTWSSNYYDKMMVQAGM